MSDETQPSDRSQRGLDWLNFFVVDVETGLSPFIATYLTGQGFFAAFATLAKVSLLGLGLLWWRLPETEGEVKRNDQKHVFGA